MTKTGNCQLRLPCPKMKLIRKVVPGTVHKKRRGSFLSRLKPKMDAALIKKPSPTPSTTGKIPNYVPDSMIKNVAEAMTQKRITVKVMARLAPFQATGPGWNFFRNLRMPFQILLKNLIMMRNDES